MKAQYEAFAVGRGWAHIEERGKEGARYLDGYVVTPDGIVDVYAQGDDINEKYTRLRFASRGVMHSLTHPKRYARQKIVTLAKAFAKTVKSAKK